jgi:RHS repeat-associated protein
LIEETHYYPFGLTMAGISSKSAGKLENKNKFNGIELNNDFDLNIYDAFYRNLDPQIGRFWQVDPKPTDMESPYAGLGNNPIFNIDPLGDTVILSDAFKNNKAAMAGFELYKNTDAFKSQFGAYDIANGYAGGEEAGAQSANTNIVFDLFDDKASKGNTSLTLADNEGKQKELWKLDKSAVDKETKAELRISLDPSIHTTKTGFAVGLNHEGSVHGTGMLKALSVLREKGGAPFFDAWKQAATSPKLGDNLASFSSRYISNEFSHGQVGAGQNLQYNAVNTQIRNQLSPTERKTYDAKVSANIKTYSAPAENYKRYY